MDRRDESLEPLSASEPKTARPRLRGRDPQGFLDRWWPTLIRYAGLAAVGWEIGIDKAQHPEVFVLAGGMMGLKDVIESKRAKNGKGS